MFHQRFKKAISFKQALVVVILLHVGGYCAISKYSSYRAEKRKQALIVIKQEEAELQRMINKDTSSMFPQRGKPVVVALSPFKPTKIEEKHSEESPIKRAVNTIAQLALDTLVQKAVNMIHSSTASSSATEQPIASADDSSFKAGFCPNPNAIRTSFVPDTKKPIAKQKSNSVETTLNNKAVSRVAAMPQPNKCKPQTVYSKTATVKYPQINQETLKSEFLKIKNQLASISDVEKEVTQFVRSNIRPHTTATITKANNSEDPKGWLEWYHTTATVTKADNNNPSLKSAQDEFDRRVQSSLGEFNRKVQSAQDYIHEDITNQIISSRVVY